MSLLDHAIWWHVYPLGALGAPVRDRVGDDTGHRLRRLDAWLDYARDLGCSGLLLGPVFEASAHGYDTLDHYRIDPRLGDDADFDHLVEQCRARGMSILLDGVFNHVSVDHALVRAALAGQGGGIRLEDVDGVRRARGWEGHGDLAELDHDSPAVVDLVADVMLHWLRRGIVGWRLDVAYAVAPAFWREVLGRVRQDFPDAVFVGEVIHGDYAAIAREGTLDSVTQYELWKATWSAIHDVNMWELAHALERHEQFSQELVLQTFVGNHDVSRIASVVGDAGSVLALTLLMTVPGMPSIYYGDEQAFRGGKGEGWHADADVRPPLPDTPDRLAPYGWWLYELHQRLVGLRRDNPWLVRGHVEVLAKENEWIEYATSGDGHRLEAHLEIAPQPWVEVAVDGESVFRWDA